LCRVSVDVLSYVILIVVCLFAIAAALEAVAQAVGQQPNANAEVKMLETFLRNHPPTFKGRYDPDGAQTWLKEIERIFRVM